MAVEPKASVVQNFEYRHAKSTTPYALYTLLLLVLQYHVQTTQIE